MLNDLDETLKALLIQDLPRVTERIEPDGFDVRFEAPSREFRTRLTRPTISLFLYNIQENRDLRGRSWGQTRRTGTVETRRPPVHLDCSYMVTAWSSEVEDEHRLLTGAARVLFRNPVLPANVLQGGLAQEQEITTAVAQPEGLKDVIDIWSVLDNDLHPSVRVTVTIPLEVDVAIESPQVLDRTRTVTMGPPGWQPPAKGRMRIQGRLERDGEPVSGALIRADYSSTHTGQRGEYTLHRVEPGKQLVFVHHEGEFYQLEADLPRDAVLQLPSAAKDGAEGSPAGPDAPADGSTEESSPPRDGSRRRRPDRGT
ncbi:MAG: DUF4255 domain-containing protein [Dehalococcoidia bacterium]